MSLDGDSPAPAARVSLAATLLASASLVMLALPAAAMPSSAAMLGLCNGGKAPMPGRGNRSLDCAGACHAAGRRRPDLPGDGPDIDG